LRAFFSRQKPFPLLSLVPPSLHLPIEARGHFHGRSASNDDIVSCIARGVFHGKAQRRGVLCALGLKGEALCESRSQDTLSKRHCRRRLPYSARHRPTGRDGHAHDGMAHGQHNEEPSHGQKKKTDGKRGREGQRRSQLPLSLFLSSLFHTRNGLGKRRITNGRTTERREKKGVRVDSFFFQPP
jgi:hypothetical protein